MGSGKGGLRADRRPSRESAMTRESQNESRLPTPPALSAGGSATADLTGHSGGLNPNECPDGCFVEMTFVKTKRSNIIRFAFGGVDPHSRLANETIPFLLEALCTIPVARSVDGVITTEVERHEDFQGLRGRDPGLVCRVINHLRHSGLKDDAIVRLMNGTLFSKHLSVGHLKFEGDETVHLILDGRPKMAVRIVQEAVQDLCYWGAYELASELLDSDAVQNLPPKALWFDGDQCLRSTGWLLSTRLTDAGLDVPVDREEKYDRQFRPLKRLFGIALLARQSTAFEPAESTSESLVESSSDPLVISEDV